MLLRAVREGLADALQAIPDMSVHSYVPATPSPPALCVGDPLEGSYDDTFEGHMLPVRVPVHAFIASSDELSAATLFDGLVSNEGSASIYQAVKADRTLGGTCADVMVVGWERVTVDDQDAAILHVVVNVDVIE